MKSCIGLLCRLVLVVPLFAGLSRPAQADWRNDVGIFRIGIVSEGEASSFFEKLDPFRRALAEALKIEVEFYPAPDATSLMDAFRSDRIEYAILPATAYALAWNVCECVEPLVAPKAGDSTDGYHMVLISRPNGPKSLDELAGTSIGIMSENSITSHGWPVKLLENEGVDFAGSNIKLSFQKTASQSVQALLDEKVDSLIGWSSLTGDPATGYTRGTLNRLHHQSGVNVQTFTILWNSPQVPHRPHVVRRKLSAEAKRILRDVLLNLDEDDPIAYDAIEPVYGGGFVVASQQRFLDLISYVDGLHEKPVDDTMETPESQGVEGSNKKPALETSAGNSENIN